jgi:light-regulated signal transduction histidine kinase (bacteriophytochrome)
MEYSKKLFLLFGRLHSKADYGGTGLGLAIAKKIIDNHKGVIYATATENQGAVFSFIIPQ